MEPCRELLWLLIVALLRSEWVFSSLNSNKDLMNQIRIPLHSECSWFFSCLWINIYLGHFRPYSQSFLNEDKQDFELNKLHRHRVIKFSADSSSSDKGYLIYPPLPPSRAADTDGSRRTRTDEKWPTSHDLQYHLEQKQTSSIYKSKYNLENKKEDHRGLVYWRIYTNPKNRSEIWKYRFQINFLLYLIMVEYTASLCFHLALRGRLLTWAEYDPFTILALNSACQETSVQDTNFSS